MLKKLWDWFVSHGLWEATKWLWGAGGATMALTLQCVSGWIRGHQDLTALLLTTAAIALLIVVAIVVHRSPARPKASTGNTEPIAPSPLGRMTRVEATVLNQLFANWGAYGDIYERLDYDNRNNTSTRFPFNPASWPPFNQLWSYVHVSLYCMSQALSAYKRDTLEIIKAFSWEDEVYIPRVEPAAIMVDVIRDIREFTRQLESIRQRQVWPQ
jgi:hypothetical protein